MEIEISYDLLSQKLLEQRKLRVDARSLEALDGSLTSFLRALGYNEKDSQLLIASSVNLPTTSSPPTTPPGSISLKKKQSNQLLTVVALISGLSLILVSGSAWISSATNPSASWLDGTQGFSTLVGVALLLSGVVSHLYGD